MEFINLNLETDEKISEKLFTLTGEEKHWHILTGGYKYNSQCKNENIRKICDYLNRRDGMDIDLKLPAFHEYALSKQWSTPSKIIVAPTSDVFNPLVNDQKLFKILQFIEKNPQHKFFIISQYVERMGLWIKRVKDNNKFKLANLAVGSICENQEQYNKNIYSLVQIDVGMRFISLNPFTERMKLETVQIASKDMLWPLSGLLQNYLGEIDGKMMWENCNRPITTFRKLDWVHSCGEIGENSNPIHPAWIRGVQKSCYAEKIPFYFRSWGSLKPIANPDLENDETLVILSADGFVRGKGVGSKTNFLATFTSEDSKDIYMTRKEDLPEIIPENFKQIPEFYTKGPKIVIKNIFENLGK